MMILKVTRKQCLPFYLEDTFFEKLQVGVKLNSPSLFRVNQHCLPTFNQSSQSNQLFLDWLVKFLDLYIDCIGLFGFIQLIQL